MSKFCSQCGREIGDVKFCPHCGYGVKVKKQNMQPQIIMPSDDSDDIVLILIIILVIIVAFVLFSVFAAYLILIS